MSVASVSSFISRSQPNNYSTCRFHTAHRQAPCSGLTLPWCRNAVAYIWYGIAVLPCFSASGKVPVTRCGLPLRGTYAVNVPHWDTSLRGAEGPVPNRNCTGASRARTSCRRRAAFTGRSLYILGARTHHPKRSPPWCRRQDLNLRCSRNGIPKRRSSS